MFWSRTSALPSAPRSSKRAVAETVALCEAVGLSPVRDPSNDDPRFDGRYVKFSDVVFTPKPVQQPIPIWVGGESAPALRRIVRYADCWYPVGTNPQFPMNTVSRFRKQQERFRGFCEKAGRDPNAISVALRVLAGPGGKPRGTIDGEADMFTGGDTDWVGDIHALQDLSLIHI